MIRDLKPYPAYKDSGVPWLGKVPEGWEVGRQRETLRPAKPDGVSRSADPRSVIENGCAHPGL